MTSCIDCVIRTFSFYIKRCAHSNASVRSFSLKIAKEILTSFRWVARHKACVFVVLNLVNHLYSIINEETDEMAHASLSLDVTFPTEHTSLSTSLKDTFYLGYLIISIGLYDSPGYTTNVLVEYLMLPQVVNKTHHVGSSMIREILLSREPIYHLSQSECVERCTAAKSASKMLHDLVFSSQKDKVVYHDVHFNIDLLISFRSKYVAEASNATVGIADQSRKEFIRHHCF